MDGSRFDTITAQLAGAHSRRRVLGGLALGLGGLGGILANLTTSEAKRGGKGRGKGKGKRKGKGKKKGQPKVELCHNGQTITVGNAAVASHLAHGDCQIMNGGSCCPAGSAVTTSTCAPAGGTCCGAGGFVEGTGAVCCANGSGATSCPTGQVCCPTGSAYRCAATLGECKVV